MRGVCVRNARPFRYVLSDSWFSSTENMLYIKQTLRRDFVLPLKSNRRVALSAEDQKQRRRHPFVPGAGGECPGAALAGGHPLRPSAGAAGLQERSWKGQRSV